MVPPSGHDTAYDDRRRHRRDATTPGNVQARRNAARQPLDAVGRAALPSAHRADRVRRRPSRRGEAMRYDRISADCHLDLIWLPPDLFVSEAPTALKDHMPYVTDGPDGPRWVARNGAAFGLAGGVGASGTAYVPGKQLRVDAMAAAGLYE